MLCPLLAAAAFSWVSAQPPALALLRGRLEAIIARHELPLIDLSSTEDVYVLEPGPLAERLDELGVAVFGVSCELEDSPGSGAAEDWQACAENAARIRPDVFVALPNADFDYARFMDPPQDPYEILERAAAQVRAGAPTLGPVRLWTFAYWEERVDRRARYLPEIRSVPPEGELARRLLVLAETSGIPLQVLGEADDRFLPRLEAMLAAHPKARVVWGRAGMVHGLAQGGTYSAEYVGRLLDRYPNLYLELSSGLGNMFDREAPPRNLMHDEKTDTMKPEWKALIEKHPWRFISGFELSSRELQRLPSQVKRQRAILRQLSPRAAEIVAYKSAWKLFFHESL